MRALDYQHQKKKPAIFSNPLPFFSLRDFAAALAVPIEPLSINLYNGYYEVVGIRWLQSGQPEELSRRGPTRRRFRVEFRSAGSHAIGLEAHEGGGTGCHGDTRPRPGRVAHHMRRQVR